MKPRCETPSAKSQKKEWGVWGASSLAPHFRALLLKAYPLSATPPFA
jgi:hypothetical protein